MTHQPLSVPVARAREELALLAGMANRHGLVAGATGTGKTVTLRVLAEGFSRLGVPVFMADVKGDLSGLAKAGVEAPPISDRVRKLGLAGFAYQAVDRESAYEKLRGRAEQAQPAAPPRGSVPGGGSRASGAGEATMDVLESMAKSAARAAGTQIGREIIRGVLGSLFGGRRR